MADKKAPARSVREIESEIASRRNRLAGTVDELVYRTSPVELKRRATVQVQQLVQDKKDQAVSTLVGKTHTEEGELDMKLVGNVLAGIGGTALTFGVLRALFHK